VPNSATKLPFLVFGLVGWSWLDIDTNFRVRDIDTDETIFDHDDNVTANGLTVGGGVEWKFTDYPLSIHGNYRFTSLDNFDNNGNFDRCGDWGCDSFRSRNRRCQRPARALHPQLALWWLRRNDSSCLLIRSLCDAARGSLGARTLFRVLV
jgi:hypothetical protein